MKSSADFEQFYATELLPVLEPLEARRNGIVRKIIGFDLAIVLLAAGAAVFLMSKSNDRGMLVLPAVVGLFLMAGVWWWLTHEFVHEFKTAVVGSVVRFCDPSLTYAPRGSITQGEFMESRLFLHRVDRYKGEDLVTGAVDKTQLRFSEIHAQYKTESRNSRGHRRTQWHTIFKGLFFIADFNKAFSGQTIVLPDTAERLFGALGQKLQGMDSRRGELVKLEDPDFEKLFVVYGTDQIEARYVLSTSLMRRLVEFRKRTGKPLHVAFVRSNVCVAITTGRNMFEPRILRSVLDPSLAREYLDDLEFACGVVDDLNLNTRIWTKA
jgi:hypothetical protein